jgi:hypothetical protein
VNGQEIIHLMERTSFRLGADAVELIEGLCNIACREREDSAPQEIVRRLRPPATLP